MAVTLHTFLTDISDLFDVHYELLYGGPSTGKMWDWLSDCIQTPSTLSSRLTVEISSSCLPQGCSCSVAEEGIQHQEVWTSVVEAVGGSSSPSSRWKQSCTG